MPSEQLHAPRRPLHERIPLLGWIRRPLRNVLFQTLERLANTDDARNIFAAQMRSVNHSLALNDRFHTATIGSPYSDLGTSSGCQTISPECRPIFVTARFRSGSTLLWNLFRNHPACTAYYEPLNERRWFDPANRGSHMDQTHRRIDDYWREYDGLEMLRNIYQQSWIDRNLFMEATFHDPQLKEFIQTLIAHAPRRPVLQFNRVDFRLPWLRSNFPEAQIVHLFRHPRDQWCSALMKLDNFTRHDAPEKFWRHDKFYLGTWCRDLRYVFPFLEITPKVHPYRLFYYVWKLSYLLGVAKSDTSLSFESIVLQPEETLGKLFDTVHLCPLGPERLKSLLEPPALQKWKAWADDEWYCEQESQCESVLAEFFRTIASSTDSDISWSDSHRLPG